ncbi:thiamine phosphate synthase [Melissococcus sp. OM08-11BH]|uniref:thiamine phosphate synthase n=1 Tax=Melissococcus sp. OM08-11BH TaxID=2293110 RepID=UPI000E46BE36|nr:thiamine phosphate synthase [Melissococcus sp. OM08-11BH]RGI30336.1 thiamine phosphate synthase [Melissococcus sp. OM08-11BH]
MIEEALTLYVVTNSDGLSDEAFIEKVEQACQNGVTLVQLREKKASTQEFYQKALAIKKVTDKYHVPLIINDRVDVCLAVDADGVHIGDDELPVDVTRRLIGPDKWLGVSAKTAKRALEAKEQGVDYLGVGAIFPTKTKENAPTTDISILQEIIHTSQLPVVAIGGIKEDNMHKLNETDISGVAIVSDIMQADDVAKKTQVLKKQIVSIKEKNHHDN